ncbi:hypothetical protein [Anaeromyxobacter terrae]|uniref:hypothetical protein n=1 Tax=Anaeromyxobacter terrae TaxID=2925406 RepID=UPI001F598CF5|nr:hypothetical protein [Anaeromyxobacter sp. SG22]
MRQALAVAALILAACGGPDENGCVVVERVAPDGSSTYENACPEPIPLNERTDRSHQPVYTTPTHF